MACIKGHGHASRTRYRCKYDGVDHGLCMLYAVLRSPWSMFLEVASLAIRFIRHHCVLQAAVQVHKCCIITIRILCINLIADDGNSLFRVIYCHSRVCRCFWIVHYLFSAYGLPEFSNAVLCDPCMYNLLFHLMFQSIQRMAFLAPN